MRETLETYDPFTLRTKKSDQKSEKATKSKLLTCKTHLGVWSISRAFFPILDRFLEALS